MNYDFPPGRVLGQSFALIPHKKTSRPGRYRRYLTGLLPVLGVIWTATGAYLLLAPVSYTSKFSLIMPGTAVGSSLNLEGTGQAQATVSSPFDSPSLSPTEGYKQLLTADVTLSDAAGLAHVKPGRFPAPTVKLIEQTNLIGIQVTGHTAAEAQRNADALRNAFFGELDKLRTDEAARREANDLVHLRELSAKEQLTERKLIAFQAMHGLATMEQFNARIASVDQLKDKEREYRLSLSEHRGEAGRLSGTMDIGPSRANLEMRLRGDPVFQELATRYAAANADAELKAGTLGPKHAALAQANAEREGLKAALLARGHDITGLSDAQLMHATDMTLGDGRSQLMQTMAVGDAQAAGAASALSVIRGDLAEAKARSPELIEQASQLADLQRDHHVAEAVLSSALARLDTNKLDPFASYPLVQTLAPPSLPDRKSSPSLVLALAGAMGATIIALLTFGTLWLRQPIIDRMLRNG